MKKEFLTIILVCISIYGKGQNLISNSSFQYPNMQPRCDGWFNSCGEELINHCDTNLSCFVGLINQSPSLIPEDIWSLKIKTGFPQEAFAETYITGQSGNNIYELKFWMKATDWKGGARIGLNTQDLFIESKSLIDTTTLWKEFSLVDTINTQLSDTITVRLTAEIGDFCFCPPINFAFVQLSKLGTTSLIENDDLVFKIITFPNPSFDKIFFESNNLINNYFLTVYNNIGQLVNQKKINGNVFEINKNEIGQGLFTYRIMSNNFKQIAKGKIVFD